MKIPELLAPAGGMEAFRAAVENGADAIYLGGQAFNARASAANFTLDELQTAIKYAHLRRVKVYVTVNILIDNREITELVDYLYQLYHIGVDAVILQDLGVAYLAHRILPELPLHASTQMTVVNSPGVKLMQELGFERVVLARETELRDMAAIYHKTGADLEVFVHGALCICYSGQCLMSSMIGGRSGNRGRCAQPCRMSYQLMHLKDNTPVPGIEVGEHLLSPKDLNLLDNLADLAEAGVGSLKVEGRMKRPEYVATVIRNYRQALDRVQQGVGSGTEEEHRELAQIFNREFTSGHLLGNQGFELMSYKRPNNRGVMLGRIQQYDKNKGQAQLKLEAVLNVGDGIEVWVKKGREGVYVHHIWQQGQELATAYPGQLVWIEFPTPVATGNRVFKTHDEVLVQKARVSYQEGKETRKTHVSFQVSGQNNAPLRIVASDQEGNTGIGVTEAKLEPALKRPLTREYLATQLDRLGNTPFVLEDVSLDLEGDLIVPVREINEARRQAVEALVDARLTPRLSVTRQEFEQRLREVRTKAKPVQQTKAALSVSVGDLASLDSAISSGADIVYFGGDLFRSKPVMGKEDLARGVEKCLKRGVKPVLQLPRLVAEHRLDDYMHTYLENLASLGAKAIQVADLGALNMVKGQDYEIFGDYQLNVFNDMTLQALSEQGVRFATLSPELNFQQLERFKFTGELGTELIVHGTLPLMITEYCAMGSLVGGGKREGCSRPCKINQFGLKDRMNFIFPLESDLNCRMYVYNAKEINMIEHLKNIWDTGPAILRLELKREPSGYVGKVTRHYRRELDRVLANPRNYNPDTVNIEELMELRPGGYTKGHYFRGVV